MAEKKSALSCRNNAGVKEYESMKEQLFPCRFNSDGCGHKAAAELVELQIGDIAFHVTGEDGENEFLVTEKLLARWGITQTVLQEQVGQNSFDYISWTPLVENGPPVYLNDDDCFGWVLLAPRAFAEHNEVVGAHLMVVVEPDTALVVGTKDVNGQSLILDWLKERAASMEKLRLLSRLLVLRDDWKSWEICDDRTIPLVTYCENAFSTTRP